MTKDIWLPKGETKVTVQGEKVTVWDEMRFIPKPVTPTGFGKDEGGQK